MANTSIFISVLAPGNLWMEEAVGIFAQVHQPSKFLRKKKMGEI